MKVFTWFKSLCEFAEGCGAPPPPGVEKFACGWVRGLWWGVLLGIIILFCGQTSKFIYIDF
jgi:hypothetical protein